jgi:hypothetical protein
LDYTHWKDRNPKLESVELTIESGSERHIKSVWKANLGKTTEVRSIQRIVSAERFEEDYPVGRNLVVKSVHIFQENGNRTLYTSKIYLQFLNMNFVRLLLFAIYKPRMDKVLRRILDFNIENAKQSAKAVAS